MVEFAIRAESFGCCGGALEAKCGVHWQVSPDFLLALGSRIRAIVEDRHRAKIFVFGLKLRAWKGASERLYLVFVVLVSSFVWVALALGGCR